MSPLKNLDLISVGLTVASIGILGFIVFFSRPKSITSKAFLLFSIVTIFYGIVNYLSYQASNRELTLFLLRLVIFSAVWHAYSFYLLFTVFPEDDHKLSKRFWFIITPVVAITSILTLTPLIFSGITEIIAPGEVAQVTKGPGILLFVIVVALLIIGGIWILVRKMRNGDKLEQKQFRVIFWGVFLTFACIVTFNFLLPIFAENVRFIAFGALFMLPFTGFTFYAIAKHELLQVKVVSTEIVTFILAVVSIIELIVAPDITTIVFRSGVFIMILIFGILLIKSVIKEVKQREKLEELSRELAGANDRLRVLDQQKSEFLSIASHQLRSPLTAIKGYSSMILEGSFGKLEAKMKEAIERIFLSSERLVIVIEDFLNISRIEQGRMQYDFASVDMAELVDGVMKELEQNAKRAGLTFTFNKKDTGPFVITADFGKVRQVVTNIVDNAIKYTPKGSITVTLDRDADTRKVLLSVTDTGIGISRETLPTLFQKFVRAKGASKVSTSGTGLGLYVVKELMKAHKGQVWVDSPGEGKGSTFYLEFMAE